MKFFLFIVIVVFSLPEIKACPIHTICGSATATIGQSVTYTLAEDAIYTPFSFTVANGTVTSTSRSNFNYTVVITWTTIGTGSIKFDQDAGVPIKTITVTCPYTNPA